MATECFIPRQFSGGSLAIIEAANRIIDEYQAQGFTLTLRQAYYQFVSRGLLANKQTEYKRLGSILNDARLAGLIDWDAIEDRTRNVRTVSSWDDPSEIIKSAAQSYKEDLWKGQKYRVEVWIEKDALLGVIEPACNRWRLPYYACRGYSSQSEQYRAGKRFAEWQENGQRPIVFHLGDHDPSGIDMTRDNSDRLEMFAERAIPVERLALNMDQVRRYNPPPNPAKESDGRAAGYIERFGRSSWELDALDPRVIDQLIENAVRKRISLDLWNASKQEEQENRDLIKQASSEWSAIVKMLARKKT